MKTGWVQDTNGTWYYMGSSGAMLTDTSITEDGETYYFDESGACTNP